MVINQQYNTDNQAKGSKNTSLPRKNNTESVIAQNKSKGTGLYVTNQAILQRPVGMNAENSL